MNEVYGKPDQLRALLARAAALQEAIWSHAEDLAEQDSNDIYALFSEGLNDVFNLHTRRVVLGAQYRIPFSVWCALILASCIAMVAVGFHFGISSKRSLIANLVLALAFALVMQLIFDLDRPGEGAIQLNQRRCHRWSGPNWTQLGSGVSQYVHQGSVPEARRVVRERRVDAVVVSVHQCGRDHVDAVDHLVRRFPEVPTVALVTRTDPVVPELLLRLGATGVRHVVDVTAPAGWRRLRQLLLEPLSRPAARILARVFEVLVGLPPGTRMFLEYMVRVAPVTPNLRQLARQIRVAPNGHG